MQACLFRVQHQQRTTRQDRHRRRGPGDVTERRLDAHRLTAEAGLRMRLVRPQPDVLFVHVETLMDVIDLAVFALRRQAQVADLAGVRHQAAVFGHQPLLAQTFLADHEKKVVVAAVAVQAKTVDLEIRLRQMMRFPAQVLTVEARQQRLLMVFIHQRHQQALLVAAVVHGAEPAGQMRQGLALLADQEQPFHLIGDQHLGFRQESQRRQPLGGLRSDIGLQRNRFGDHNVIGLIRLTGGLLCIAAATGQRQDRQHQQRGGLAAKGGNGIANRCFDRHNNSLKQLKNAFPRPVGGRGKVPVKIRIRSRSAPT